MYLSFYDDVERSVFNISLGGERGERGGGKTLKTEEMSHSLGCAASKSARSHTSKVVKGTMLVDIMVAGCRKVETNKKKTNVLALTRVQANLKKNYCFFFRPTRRWPGVGGGCTAHMLAKLNYSIAHNYIFF